MEGHPENFARRKLPIKILNTVLDEETGELMEIRHLMNKPKYRKVWGTYYGN